MMQRRLAWAIGACLAPVIGMGCHAEATSGSQGEGSGASRVEAQTTSRGAALVTRAQKAFRLGGAVVLTASPVESFTAEANGIAAKTTARRDAKGAHVTLPRVADGAMTIEASGMHLSVRPRGFAASPIEWAQHVAVYPDVAEGTHVFRRADGEGVEDFYQVDAPRDSLSFTYDIAFDGVAGLRVVEGNIELLDASGAPRLTAPAPMVVDARGVRREGKMSVRDCAFDTSPNGPWGRPVVSPGNSQCVVTATIDGRGLSYPVLVDPAWKPTFNSKQTHAYHKMLLLPAGTDAGKVLLVGGTGSAAGITELFDPASGTWASSTVIADLAQGTNAVVLSNGVVVVAGGLPSTGFTAKASVQVRSATGVWSPGSAMSTGRAYHVMTVIKQGGKELVLAAGGQLQDTLSTSAGAFKSAEIYDPTPAVDAWKGAGSMASAHTRAAAAVLSDGRVVVTGGNVYSSFSETAQDTVDIYDPAAGGGTGAWSPGGTMSTARANHVAVALATTGMVVAGGLDATGNESGTLDYFDGATWKVVTSKLATPRQLFTGDLLSDGRVLFAGGQYTDPTSFSTIVTETAEIYTPGATPATGTTSTTVSMGSPRRRHATVSLGAKGLLAVGGETSDISSGGETSLSEIFDTSLGKACATTATCPASTFCTEGVCCSVSACPTGETCKSPGHEGVCTKAKGSACTSGSECATGYCSGGYCCDSACAGSCKSCSVAGSLGTCINAPAGTDPGGLCAGGFGDPVCGTKCDGAGSCGSSATAGTPCGKSLADGGTASFCNRDACDGFGFCNPTTYNCGLTCTSSVTCVESTKSCTPSSSGVKAGYCVIDSKCWSYGDVDPADSCHVCNPPLAKTAWSIADSCDAGVVDTGVDTGADDTGVDETGSGDTGTTGDTLADSASDGGADVTDSGSTDDTSSADTSGPLDTGINPGETDLPSKSACGCETPGASSSTPLAYSLAMLGLGLALTTRRRRPR